jgi:hypothetical protein
MLLKTWALSNKFDQNKWPSIENALIASLKSRQQSFKQRPAIDLAVNRFDHVFGFGQAY